MPTPPLMSHRRTNNLDRRNNEVGNEELPYLRGEARLSCEHPLRDAHQHVAHGRRHEHAVQRHLWCLRLNLCSREDVRIQRGILGHPPRRDTREMCREDFLEELQDT